MSGRAATDRILRGRFGISVNDPGHPTPPGWVRTPLTDIADLGTGHTPSRNHPEYWDGDVPWIGIRDAGAHHGGIINTTAQTITPLGLENSSARMLPKETVCLSRTASVGYVVKMGRDMATSQDFVTWSCSQALDPDFLMSALLAEGEDIRKFGEGSTHTTIYFPAVKAFHLDLPPITEQRRIVAKLDALTARIARARAELARVPVLAEKLRQSVVVDAFSGRLTEELRRASQLKAEDNEHLDNLFARKTKAKRKKPAAAIDWQPKLAIPDEWRWVSVDRVIAIAQYGSSSKTDENSDGVPVLRMGNIQSGELDFSNLKYLPLGHHEFPDLLLTDGDVLFNRTNSFELVGKSAVFRGASRPMSYASYLIRLQCCGILPDLLVRYLNSPLGRSWIESVASQQVGQANVNGTKLRSLGIPLPSEEEQVEMKRLMDVAFARADRLEAEAARARKLLDRLESTILAKAFRGELVPQNPNDEPAEKLLKRIRADRAAAPKPKRARRAAT
ncbi:restriction endonuclease subunit S [Agrobacterium tumefaciens]|uniref:restriction endonuclease subunit S n=1 Tax=Rhizobium sp. X9 TaxID=2815360 RepID=UPI00263B875C|nr:restriction endonuclease subunit S [Rhizobium sp. X9]WKL22630.1 restriction endonuclease subunit S [Agrobacterium tumefaciens]